MAQGYGQRELIGKQREMEDNPKNKLPVKEGSFVEFVDTPEFNGVVRRISKDQWQTVYIDYGNEEKTKFIHGYEFTEMFYRKKVIVKNVNIKVGTKIKFFDKSECIGIIRKVKKDQWQTVCIEVNEGLNTNEIKGFKFIQMLETGKISIIK